MKTNNPTFNLTGTDAQVAFASDLLTAFLNGYSQTNGVAHKIEFHPENTERGQLQRQLYNFAGYVMIQTASAKMVIEALAKGKLVSSIMFELGNPGSWDWDEDEYGVQNYENAAAQIYALLYNCGTGSFLQSEDEKHAVSDKFITELKNIEEQKAKRIIVQNSIVPIPVSINRSEIMKNAWKLVKEAGLTLSAALKRAWAFAKKLSISI